MLAYHTKECIMTAPSRIKVFQREPFSSYRKYLFNHKQIVMEFLQFTIGSGPRVPVSQCPTVPEKSCCICHKCHSDTFFLAVALTWQVCILSQLFLGFMSLTIYMISQKSNFHVKNIAYINIYCKHDIRSYSIMYLTV